MTDLAKDAAYYKDSVEILGLSLGEMESFINPAAAAEATQTLSNKKTTGHIHQQSPTSLVSSRGSRVARNQENSILLDRLERINHMAPKDLLNLPNTEIEDIGEQCVRMITDMTGF